MREARTMRRQVDHHLARARAVGRRGSRTAARDVWPSLESVERAVARLYPNVRIDVDGPKTCIVHVERQDLDEMLGNLIENAAKYGGGSVFVTVGVQAGFVEFIVEDDGRAFPRTSASASSTAACGSTAASPAPASASRSCATWRRFTTAPSGSRRARIWADCWSG
jgi:K+-sensing histidine kinase KdpD